MSKARTIGCETPHTKLLLVVERFATSEHLRQVQGIRESVKLL